MTPPETPEFNPEKYILNAEKFDLTGKSLLDDDKELADKVAETNANPYADKADNNEAANINTKTVKRGDKVVYQVWLDTTKFTERTTSNLLVLLMTTKKTNLILMLQTSKLTTL